MYAPRFDRWQKAHQISCWLGSLLARLLAGRFFIEAIKAKRAKMKLRPVKISLGVGPLASSSANLDITGLRRTSRERLTMASISSLVRGAGEEGDLSPMV